MSNLTDIQATHQVIQLFENSKMKVDDDLDSLPGIYTVIDSNGQIYRGNKTLGKLFETDCENLLGLNIAKLFSGSDWKKLSEAISNCAEFDLASDEIQVSVTVSEGSFVYLWNMMPIKNVRPDVPLLITLIGRDITESVRATERNARMQHELETAGVVQSALFPMKETTNVGKSVISGFYLAASECAGDWWSYSVLDNKLFIWIGDVEGHGVPAALVTSAVRAAVLLIDRIELRPSKILSILSKVVSIVAPDKKLMTFCVIAIDLDTGATVFANAAHEHGFLVHPKLENHVVDDIKELPVEASYPLGFNLSYEYTETRLDLQRGDRLIFFSDGILDIFDPAGKRWSRPSFRRTLLPFVSKSIGAADLVRDVRQSISDFRKGAALVDDVTFLVFQF